jgi:hypothetical protein
LGQRIEPGIGQRELVQIGADAKLIPQVFRWVTMTFVVVAHAAIMAQFGDADNGAAMQRDRVRRKGMDGGLEMNLGDFSGEILVGTVCLIVGATGSWVRQWWAVSRHRKRFTAKYHVFKNDQRVEDQVVTIEKESWNRLLLVSMGKDSEDQWHSRIVLNPDNPYFGNGHYEYEGKHSWGEHIIHLNKVAGSIVVTCVSQSDSLESCESRSFLLKRASRT